MRSKDQILLEKLYTQIAESEQQMEFGEFKSNPSVGRSDALSGGLKAPQPPSTGDETLSPKLIQSLKNTKNEIGSFKLARRILSSVLSSKIGMSLSDIADTSMISSVVEDIESYLEDEDFEGAILTAKDSVEDIIADQF